MCTVSQKGASIILPITLPNIDRSSKSFRVSSLSTHHVLVLCSNSFSCVQFTSFTAFSMISSISFRGSLTRIQPNLLYDLSGRRWRLTLQRHLYMLSSAAVLITVTPCCTVSVTVCWRIYKPFRTQLLGSWRGQKSSTTSRRCFVTFTGFQSARESSTNWLWQFTSACAD